MIVGSGFIAQALHDDDAVIYAAGVSNPTCADASEYARDAQRLERALSLPGRFVYISTTSTADSPYVRHKRAMERMVLERENTLVCRVPTVAGRCTNPHTLLNWLWSRITRGEKFELWADAKRNIVLAGYVGSEVRKHIRQHSKGIVDITWPHDYHVVQIVEAMEHISGKKAVYELKGKLALCPTLPADDYLYLVLGSCYP